MVPDLPVGRGTRVSQLGTVIGSDPRKEKRAGKSAGVRRVKDAVVCNGNLT